MTFRSHFLFVLVLIFCSVGSIGWMKYGIVQENEVPIKVQIPLFLKILSFDRNLRHTNNTIMLGVAYQSSNRNSRNTKEEFERYISQNPSTIGSSAVQVRYIDLDAANSLENTLNNRFSAVYISPLRAYDINRILNITQDSKVLSLTGVPEYVEQGVSVGLALKMDKPLILINLNSSKAEGREFSAQLLKLAKIVE